MYKDLNKDFYQFVKPSYINNPKIMLLNKELLNKLAPELDANPKLAEILAGKELYFDQEPLAMVYAGHQFGHFNPRLGDGRAILLGERSEKELHLKGSGPTLYSRGGDGLCPLGPAIREYIMSMAMKNLGINTTETLSVCLTGEDAYREEVHPAANLIRVANSHIRIGTFEYFFYRNEYENIKALADYAIKKLYPGLSYLDFFKEVAKNQIKLINSWMSIGFIHGVMNTDNCLISGEAIDYGPCAFMDEYKYDQWFSSIDRNGRYRYSNQMNIILWNLSCFVTALSPLINKEGEDLNKYWRPIFDELEEFQENDYTQTMLKKFGIKDRKSGDKKIIQDFLSLLEKEKLDYTNSFRNIDKTLKDLKNHPEIDAIIDRYHQGDGELRDSVNPYIIPRNHLVEEAIEGCYQGHFKALEDLLSSIETPYKEDPKWSELTKEKPNKNFKTFCGT